MIESIELARKQRSAYTWTSLHAEKLRTFLLDTEAGRQLSLLITANRPTVKADSVEIAALTGQLRAGWMLVEELIGRLTFPPVEPEKSAIQSGGYADLDDETAWDGTKPKQ